MLANLFCKLRQMRKGWQPERPVRVKQPAGRMKRLKRIIRLDYYHLAQPPGTQGGPDRPPDLKLEKRL